MNIHPGIPAEYHEEILDAAKDSGLDAIEDWGSTYYLTKVSGNNNRIIPAGRVGRGVLTLIGSKGRVGLYLNSTDEWFRTSAVVKCTKNEKGYEIVTENSVYQLDK
jgi:hypothetical protein